MGLEGNGNGVFGLVRGRKYQPHQMTQVIIAQCNGKVR